MKDIGMNKDNQRDFEEYNHQPKVDDKNNDNFGHKPLIIFAAYGWRQGCCHLDVQHQQLSDVWMSQR